MSPEHYSKWKTSYINGHMYGFIMRIQKYTESECQALCREGLRAAAKGIRVSFCGNITTLDKDSGDICITVKQSKSNNIYRQT